MQSCNRAIFNKGDCVPMVVVSHFKINFERLNNVFAKLGIKYYIQHILILFFIFSAYVGSTQVSDPWIYIGGSFPILPNFNVVGLQKFNPYSGELKTMAELPFITDIAFNPDGRLFGCFSSQIFEIDTSGFAFPASPKQMIYSGDIQHLYFAGMTIDHTGLIWLVGHNGVGRKRAVFTYDLNTGILTEVGLLPWELSYLDIEWYNGKLYTIGHRIPIDGDIMLTKINLKNFDLSDNVFFPENVKSWGLASINNECESLELYATSGTDIHDPRGLYHFNAALDSYSYINNPTQSAANGATSRTSWLGSYTPLGIDSVTVKNNQGNCVPPFALTAHIHRGYYMRPDIEYSLDGVNYQQDSVFNNLAPGKYVLHLKDSLGCFKKSDSIAVGNYATFNYISAIKEDYCGLGNGLIELRSNNHTAFSLDQINFTSDSLTINQLNSGDYTIIMRNTDGCLDTLMIFVPGQNAFTAFIQTVPDTCNSGKGSVAITTTGNQGFISLSTDGLDYIAGNKLSGLNAGNQVLLIKDSLGCVINQPLNIDNIGGPLFEQLNLTQPSCNLNDGMIHAVGTGDDIHYFLNNIENNTGIFTNLAAGQYILQLKDQYGCTSDTTFTLVGKNAAIIQSVNIQDAHCDTSNGIVEIFVENNVNISISPDGINYILGNKIENLSDGNYTLFIKNDLGCITSVQVELKQTGLPWIDNVFVKDATCDSSNAVIKISAIGNGPLQYQLNGIDQSNNTNYIDLKNGNYLLRLKDIFGCVIDTSITVNNIGNIISSDYEVIPGACGAKYSVIKLIGPPDNNYTLLETGKQGKSGDTLQLESGTYHLHIYNEYCTKDTILSIIANDCPIFIPNVFTPNHDGVNDELEVFTNGSTRLTGMTITDRWGGVKYMCTGPHCKWDGTFQGKLVNPGIYVIMVKYINSKGEEILKSQAVAVMY